MEITSTSFKSECSVYLMCLCIHGYGACAKDDMKTVISNTLKRILGVSMKFTCLRTMGKSW